MLSATVKAYRPIGVSALACGEAAGPTALASAGGGTNPKGRIAPEARRNSTHSIEP